MPLLHSAWSTTTTTQKSPFFHWLRRWNSGALKVIGALPRSLIASGTELRNCQSLFAAVACIYATVSPISFSAPAPLAADMLVADRAAPRQRSCRWVPGAPPRSPGSNRRSAGVPGKKGKGRRTRKNFLGPRPNGGVLGLCARRRRLAVWCGRDMPAAWQPLRRLHPLLRRLSSLARTGRLRR